MHLCDSFLAERLFEIGEVVRAGPHRESSVSGTWIGEPETLSCVMGPGSSSAI
jgi:hypothetical protein